MLSPVLGRPYPHWLTAYDVCFAALMDAHETADTLHCDVNFGNIIIARLKEKMERDGYLIDWELSCRRNKVMVHERAVIACLIPLAQVEVLICV